MLKTSLDTSHELKICRYKQGIKLVRPDKLILPHHATARDTSYTVNDLFALPFNVYFMNEQSQLESANSACIASVGFDSYKNALGKTLSDVIEKKQAAKIIRHDDYIRKHQSQHFFDEEGLRPQDSTYLNFLTLKMPWYNANNQVVGLFGFGISLSLHSLAQSLQSLAAMNFASSVPHQKRLRLPGGELHQCYFSKRELTIMQHTARGKTAREIANILFLSTRTIEHYLVTIKQKLNVSSKSELIDKIIDYFL